MKIKYIFPILTITAAAMAATSCIEDESAYGGEAIPGLTVTTTPVEGGELPEINFNLGEECVINPQINYTGAGTLTYEWSVGTYNNGVKGELEVVSNERELRHSFHAGGSYYAHLNVTDGTVGVVQEYQVNINRTFEQGYMLLANDRDGKGNLTFIKDLTAEDIDNGITSIVLEHSVDRVNENVPADNLAGVTVIVVTYPVSVTRILAIYGTKSYFLDPNTFQAMAVINHEDIIPGFKGGSIIHGANALVRDPSTNRYITLIANDMIGVENVSETNTQFPSYKDFSYDVLNFASYSAYGTMNYENFYADRSPMAIKYINYAGRVSTSDLTDGDGNSLFAGHTFNNMFVGNIMTVEYEDPYWGNYTVDAYPAYVISRQTATGDYIFSVITKDEPYGETPVLNMESRTVIPVTASTAIPDENCAYAVSTTYNRTYYVSGGNSVYVLLVNGTNMSLPDKQQYALTYPSNEEVTYMTVNTDTNELIVATADKSTGRGSVYIYDVADVRTDAPDAEPKKYYPNCSDRISYIIYKPRIAN